MSIGRAEKIAVTLFLFLRISGLALAAESTLTFDQAADLVHDGKTEEGVKMGQKLVAQEEGQLGIDNPQLIDSLNQLADLFLRARRYPEAEQIRRRVIGLAEKAEGSDGPGVADALLAAGWLYSNLARYAEAEPILKRALEIRTKRFGGSHSGVAEVLNALAVLAEERGHFAEAEKLYLQALAIYQQALGSTTVRVATVRNNLATLYWNEGNLAEAERNYLQALETRKTLLGPANLQTLATENNLALLSVSMGDYESAERAFQYVLLGRQAKLGYDSSYTLSAAGNLGSLYLKVGNLTEAETLLKRVAAARERILGTNDPDTARSIFHLALLYDKREQFSQAESLHLQALHIREQILGPDHPETAGSYFYLGEHYHQMGKLAEARQAYLQALSAQEKTLGDAHEETLLTLQNLAYLSIDEGQPEEAKRWATRANGSRLTQMSRLFAFASEAERIAFLKKEHPFDLIGSMDDPEELAKVVLSLKGAVLNSLIQEDQALFDTADVSTQVLGRSWQKISDKLWQSDLSGPTQEGLEKENRADLVQEEAHLRSLLAEKLGTSFESRTIRSVDPQQINQALPSDTALVEFVRYDQSAGLLKQVPSYGALLLIPGQGPSWLRLGPATTIDGLVDRYQKFVRCRSKESSLQLTLEDLYQKVWAPIETLLPPQTKKLYLSPDSKLNTVSFGVLLDLNDRFLLERHPLVYVASGRDLLKPKPLSEPVHRAAFIMADPDLGSSKGVDDYCPKLNPLPNTRLEAKRVEACLKQAGVETTVFLGDQANETNLRGIHDPWLLHLATHGLYLPDRIGATNTALRLTNPMQRSVLALTGGMKTLRAWSGGEIPPPENDGLLTAREAGRLSLRGTWLVVLSACDTGFGEAIEGEGILGLRRGFSLAGAQHLLLTLSPVEDADSITFMEQFYPRALSGSDLEGAFDETQRERLISLRKQRGLRAALLGAGPFILSD